MITIANEMVCGNIAYENNGYKINGDYRVDPATKKTTALNVSVNKGESYSGTVNAYQNGQELSYNYNSMKQEDVSGVAAEITSLVTELEAKYQSIVLTSK